MTLEIAGLVLLLAGLVTAFLSERVSPDIAAFTVLLLLIFGGYLTPQEAFSGFSSSATLTLIAMFIIGAGLYHSGVGELVADKVCGMCGNSERKIIAALMIIAALVSSFMNNVAAAALLLPAVAGIARRTKVPLSIMLIPLTTAVMLGGTLSLIGTTSNVVASEMLTTAGLAPLGLFSFSAFGIALTAAGILYMVVFGVKLLPRNPVQSLRDEDLTSLYKIYERIFVLKIPKGSHLHAKTLAQLQFGKSLDLGVVAIERQGRQILAPGPHEKLFDGDSLIVRGRSFELEELLKLRGVAVQPIENLAKHFKERSLSTVAFRVPAGLASKTLQELAVREKFGFLVASIERGDEMIFQSLGSEKLQAGDILHSIGEEASIKELAELLELNDASLAQKLDKTKQGMIFTMTLPKGALLAGESSRSSHLGELTGFTVLALLRGDELKFPLSADEKLKDGDVIIVAGEIERARSLALLGELEVTAAQSRQAALESDDIKIMEVVVSPRSMLIGKSLEVIKFRDKYDAQVLALWREGKPLRARLARTPLKLGDALLIQVPRVKLALFSNDPDFVVLSDKRAELRTHKLGFAALAVGLMFVIEFLHIQPVEVATWTAALIMILSGALTVEETYREIDWRTIIFVAALLPIGIALERTGALQLASNSLLSVTGGMGPFGVLLVLAIFTSLISQALDGTPAVIMMAPVAIFAAQKLGASPQLFVAVVAVGASNAFLSPFSHRAHMLVMGLGGYKSRDYFRVGWRVTLLHLIVLFSVWKILVTFNLW